MKSNNILLPSNFFFKEQIIPPHAAEIEGAILGVILLDRNAAQDLLPMLSADLFYSVSNVVMFKAIKELYDADTEVNVLSLVQQLKKSNSLESIGGILAVTRMTNEVVSTTDTSFNIKILKQKSIQRKLIMHAQWLMGEAYKSDIDPFALQDAAMNNIEGIVDNIDSDNVMIHISQSIEENKKLYEKKVVAYNKGELYGTTTGSKKLDDHTGALHGGEVTVVAARPGMGKTAYALFMLKGAATAGVNSLIFSLEMTQTELVDRMIIQESNGSIDNRDLRKGSLTMNEVLLKQEIEYKISKLPITLSDKPQTPSSIRNAARKWKKGLKGERGVVYIDYLQIMDSDYDGGKGSIREQEVAKMSKALKRLSKELDMPVVVLCQLSREVDKRPNKRPQTSDLRESGAIEQDADNVWMLYRDAYYGIETNDETGDSTEGVMEIILAKNRHGARGVVKMFHNKQLSNFYDNNPNIVFISHPSNLRNFTESDWDVKDDTI
jgi:replicative DNA helicase